MSINPQTPVIVGVGQVKQRPEDPGDAVQASELMILALQAAIADSTCPSLARTIDQIAVVDGAWNYSNPALLVAEGIGAVDGTHTILSGLGGQTPQELVNLLASRIGRGELDVAVIVGAETIWSRRRRKRQGLPIIETEQSGIQPDETVGDNKPLASEFELSRGLSLPIHFYPLFESAFRASKGRSIDQHQARIANLWAEFNRVATTNPYAWSPQPLSAAEIATPGPANRIVGFPYTKSMNANWDLDLGAAIILCSAAKADGLGIGRDRWVFPLAGAAGNETRYVTNRPDLYSSTAIASAGAALRNLTGIEPSQVDLIDLYSCFPCAVEIGAEALGIGEDRTLTVTGGLSFAGGPLNNYVSHSIAAMTTQLRHLGDNAVGLVTANGGFLTKHALGLYGRQPRTDGQPFAFASVQANVDAAGSTPADSGYSGKATIEAYTVMHNHDGPEVGLFALTTANRGRTWGHLDDPEGMREVMANEAVGRTVTLGAEGRVALM